MGIRSVKRQIAKARMKAVGVENVNREMGADWRNILDDVDAHNAQTLKADGNGKIKPVYINKKKVKK